MSTSFDDRQRQFEEYLRDGITAAKTNQPKLAFSLLNRAIYLNGGDARPYLWLSATTDDPQEQIEYLEKAVSLDPTNAAARKGLALLRGKIDRTQLIPEGAGQVDLPIVGEMQAAADAFLCPRCGGRMVFSILKEQLACEYCGYTETADEKAAPAGGRSSQPGELYSAADEAEQVLDFVMPTVAGHRWAQAQQRLSCERCGALSLLPPGQKTAQCPYCGSNQVVKSSSQEELLEPQLIGVMKFDAQRVRRLARNWLGKGLFSPDNLIRAGASMSLRPGYYSFWTFDGGIEIRWSCEVAEGSGDYKQWRPASGVETRFFDDVLVPGSKALDVKEVNSLEPFEVKQIPAFKPEYLAGWPAVLYDRSLSDASLIAREAVLKKIRPQLPSLIEIGREKRNLNIGGSSWSGMTFKHILLPIWTGEYRFQGKIYHFLVNGQTGKVAGEKPRDSVKIVFLFLIGVTILVLLYLVYLILNGPTPLF